MLTLLASAARSASGDSGALSPTPVAHPELIHNARFLLDVTGAASVVGDTLDVFIQQSYDGTNFDDIIRFTQVLGNGGAKKFIADWFRNATPESELHAPTDATMAAGVTQGMKLGFPLRVKWLIAGAGTHTFTFSVSVDLDYTRHL